MELKQRSESLVLPQPFLPWPNNPLADPDCHVIAHNVIAMVVMPKVAKSGPLGSGVTATNQLMLAPRYEYDSFTSGAGETNPATNSLHQLFATEDELIFDSHRGRSPISPDQLEQSRFVITSHSRAPEVNLFGKPRVCIWPVHAINSATYRNPFDRLISFCSRVGQQDYIFTRQDEDSSTADFSGRNIDLYQYLQQLTGTEIPGFGGSFLAKYGTDRDQILTEIFDYIRSTNLFDDTLGDQNYPAANETISTSYPQFTDTRVIASNEATNLAPGHGQVTPIQIGDTRGFGRFLTISEVALHFICTADAADPISNIVPTDKSKLPINRTLFKIKLDPKKSEKRIEAMLLLEGFCPSAGWTGLRSDLKIRITGLHNWAVVGQNGETTNLGFPADATLFFDSPSSHRQGRRWGGYIGFRAFLENKRLPSRPAIGVDKIPQDPGYSAHQSYPFVSGPVTIGGSKMNFLGGPIIIEIVPDNIPSVGKSNLLSSNPTQTLNVYFPNASFPTPSLVEIGSGANGNLSNENTTANTTKDFWWTFSRLSCLVNPPANYKSIGGANIAAAGRLFGVDDDPGTFENSRSGAIIFRRKTKDKLHESDVVRSVSLKNGDYRILSALSIVPDGYMEPHPDYYKIDKHYAHNLHEANGSRYTAGEEPLGTYIKGLVNNEERRPDILEESAALPESTGDWDTVFPIMTDGPFINKPDEGTKAISSGGVPPYFNFFLENLGPSHFSPNRILSSAVMFGSLSSRVKANIPWHTLLFRPDPTGTHSGANSPPDHLLLDLFWMPVVEPYAISEPLSTAGKINMNHQIVPFTYIERSTALRALFHSERIIAVPNSDSEIYKRGNVNQVSSSVNHRLRIDADQTLLQFQNRFDAGTLFRSESEICTMYLVPEGYAVSDMQNFWQNHKITADNAKERPYATLLPRLTTKSNTYRVHYLVQSLQQAARQRGGDSTAWASWDEANDRVLGEQRGSSLIERYVDSSSVNLPDFAGASSSVKVDGFYRYRVLRSSRFKP